MPSQDTSSLAAKKKCNKIEKQKLKLSKMFVQRLRNNLDSAWVEHDAHAATHGLCREVCAELGPDDSVRSVGADDLSPDAAVPASLGATLLLCFVDVGDALSKVKFGRLLILDTLKLEEGGVGVLVPKASLVTKEDSTDVEPALKPIHQSVQGK